MKDVQKRMILIDDKDKFIGEQKNAIQIKPFIGDKNDKTLLYFTIILKGMRVIEDTELLLGIKMIKLCFILL